MKLLLHGCCADCTLKFIESIKNLSREEIKEFAVFYYNPNIHPRSEYQSRLKAIQSICQEKDVRLIIPDWKPKDYFGAIKSKDSRCPKCWNLRLEATARFAKENSFSHFSSTLITSQYQNTNQVIEIARQKADEFKVNFFVPKIICKDLETSGFYKQFYCGCCYSLTERIEEKYSKRVE